MQCVQQDLLQKKTRTAFHSPASQKHTIFKILADLLNFSKQLLQLSEIAEECCLSILHLAIPLCNPPRCIVVHDCHAVQML